MNDTSTKPKSAAGPRKNGRHNAKSTAQKAYASENDISTLEKARAAPQTPGKVRNGSNPSRDAHAQHGLDVKQRSKQRSKAKNIPSSPESGLHGSQTPPQRAIPIKAGMNTAFAGATFHASPAPSALPIPSFLSKSSGESPSGPRRDLSHAHSPPGIDAQAPTPFRSSSVPKAAESPLDFMFRAHREEKERYVQGSSQPVLPAQPSSQQNSGMAQAYTAPQPKRTFQMQHPGSIDVAELDGTPGRLMGPAFSTPYQERINAARSSTGNAARTAGQIQATTQGDAAQETDPTDALKRYLFGSIGVTAQPAHPAGGGQTASVAGPKNAFGSDGQTEAVSKQGSTVETMENDLRRILKLDAAPKYSS